MKTSIFPRMHVSLYVSDLLQTVSFYNLFFGKSPEKIKPGYVKYILEEPSLIISFVENAERVQKNFGHLGFQVASLEELDARLQIAKKQGLVSLEEIGTNCCYAKQDKFWVKDYDGVQWEVYYFHEDAEFNDPHYALGESSVCCVSENKEEANSQNKATLEAVVSAPTAKTCC